MHSPLPPSSEQLDRYLAGAASLEESRQVEAWLASGAAVERAPDTEARWGRLLARTGDRQPPSAHRLAEARGGSTRWWSVGLAVSVGFALVMTFLGIGRRIHAPGGASPRVYTTGVTQRATVTLSDGSTVILAPQSRLAVSTDQAVRSYMVTLEGQGYFTVTANATRTFVVRAGRITTRVLGTAFDVRHYGGDADVRVAVVAGKVSMIGAHARAALTLTAGRVGYATDSTAQVVTSENAAAVAEWTKGRLVFRNAPIPAMLASIGRWYGYEFRLADSTLVRQDVTVSFDANDIAGALTTLRHVLGVTLAFHGSVVTLMRVQDDAADTAQFRLRRSDWATPLERGR